MRSVFRDVAASVLVLVVWGALIILLASGCTSASRQWESNLSLDVGYGGEAADVREGYCYLGASYYLDYGVSTSVGVWNTPNLEHRGLYYGFNYSWVPFE